MTLKSFVLSEADNLWAQAVSGGRYDTLRKLMTAIHRGEIALAETQPTPFASDTAPVKARVRKVIRPKILIDSDDLPRD